MGWRFTTTEEGKRDILRLDPLIQRRVEERLAWLVENFENIGPLPLVGKYKGFFKLRVGDWRIVYEVKESERLVIVHTVDRRDKIYKRKI